MAKIYFFSISERGANDEEQANKQRLARGVLVWSVFLHLGAAAAREGTGNRTLRDMFFFSFFDQAVRYSIYLYPPSRFLVFHHNPLQFLWTFEVLTFLLICDLSFEFADSFHFSVF